MTHDPVLAELAESGARLLGNLLDDAVNGMAILGLDGRFRAVNPAMCRIVGRSEEELLGVRPIDITHPADWGVSESTMSQLLAGEIATDQAQKRYLRPDGRPVPVLRTTTVLRDGENCPVGLFTQVSDLSDAVEAQEAAIRSERRFKALVAHASDLTLVLDDQGRITYASPASVRLLGLPPDLLEGRSAFEFIHPDDIPRARDSFVSHLAGTNHPRAVHYRVRHPDGDWRQAEVLVTNLLPDPSVEGLVVNVRDITEETLFREQLAASERKFRALVGNSWDIITVHDANGRYLYCSPAVTPQLGYTPEELSRHDPAELLHPDDRETAARLTSAGPSQDRPSVQYRFRHKDGTWRWLESTAQDRLDDPAIGGVVVSTRNITAKRRRSAQQEAVAALSSSALRGGPIEALYTEAVKLVAQALDADHCLILRQGVDGTTQVIAQKGTLPGHGPDDLTERALQERRSIVWNKQSRDHGTETAGPVVESAATALIVPGTGPAGALVVHSSRAGAFSEDNIAFLEAAANVLAAAMTRDRIELELRHQALHDSLTGLPNRLLLRDRLETAMTRLARRDGALTVLFVDLDNFKLVNDSLGHPAGDRLVATVAGRISEMVRATDTVARFGGDEFVVLCEDTDAAAAGELAERLRRAISVPLELEGRSVTITTSIGMVTTTDSATSADELLSMADTAMYASKDAGKDCSTPFALHMRTEATERLEAFSGIRRGLAEGEFRLLYQPIVSLETGADQGFEALLRWQHPADGLLTPDQFIDYAEACGLIIPLGEWVIRTACAQSAAWTEAGRPGRVSVNVSGLQLTQSDISATIAAALRETGASPQDVYVEVTENAVMSDLHRATAAMKEIHAQGVNIGMDDFGTGHSSLSQLADLPFDYVKIDRSFIQRFDRDRRAAALLEAIATLCRALDLNAVAEGVETENQMLHLRGLGIPFAQGFLFGRPATPEDCLDRRPRPILLRRQAEPRAAMIV